MGTWGRYRGPRPIRGVSLGRGRRDVNPDVQGEQQVQVGLAVHGPRTVHGQSLDRTRSHPRGGSQSRSGTSAPRAASLTSRV